MRKTISILTLLMMIGALLLALILILPTLLGYERYVIVSGSMEPTIPVGAVIYDEVVPVDDIETGDIITFVPPPEFGIDDPVTHRVDRDHASPGRTPATPVRGSSRPRATRTRIADAWKMVLDGPEQARYVRHIPYVGYVYMALQVRWVQVLVIGLPALALVAYIVVTLWRLSGDGVREERQRQQEPDPQDQQDAGAGGGGVVRRPVALLALALLPRSSAATGTAGAAFTTHESNPQTVTAGIIEEPVQLVVQSKSADGGAGIDDRLRPPVANRGTEGIDLAPGDDALLVHRGRLLPRTRWPQCYYATFGCDRIEQHVTDLPDRARRRRPLRRRSPSSAGASEPDQSATLEQLAIRDPYGAELPARTTTTASSRTRPSRTTRTSRCTSTGSWSGAPSRRPVPGVESVEVQYANLDLDPDSTDPDIKLQPEGAQHRDRRPRRGPPDRALLVHPRRRHQPVGRRTATTPRSGAPSSPRASRSVDAAQADR